MRSRSPGWGRSNSRERGAEVVAGCRWSVAKEQPPRARGRVLQPLREAAHLGATPARAGPRTGTACRPRGPGSNPREGGAEDSLRPFPQVAAEQPPRARGRDVCGAGSFGKSRATPASAGPSRGRRRWRPRRRSNPRERGAESETPLPMLPGIEQPPRARGRAPEQKHKAEMGGATPASAGPRPRWTWSTRSRWSNPRERGAETGSAPQGRSGLEQPPRARGRAGVPDPQRGRRGVTPASAGPSEPPSALVSVCWSNPRERGAERTAPARRSC